MEASDEERVFERARSLSPRQVECLRLVYDRQTSKEIAARLGLSAATVDSYITEAVAALGARNRRHAAELLYGVEHPGNLIPQSSRAAGTLRPPQHSPGRLFRWSDWLPVRQSGAPGNDLNPASRLLVYAALAIFLAIGFGMLAVGYRVVSDAFAALFR